MKQIDSDYQHLINRHQQLTEQGTDLETKIITLISESAFLSIHLLLSVFELSERAEASRIIEEKKPEILAIASDTFDEAMFWDPSQYEIIIQRVVMKYALLNINDFKTFIPEEYHDILDTKIKVRELNGHTFNLVGSAIGQMVKGYSDRAKMLGVDPQEAFNAFFNTLEDIDLFGALKEHLAASLDQQNQ